MWARIDEAMARQIRRVRPVARATLDSTTTALAHQIERDFGAFVPPFALHAAAPPLVAACWTIVREALVTVHVDRLRKEAVATAVSRANACTYCVDAHATALDALGARAAADALAGAGGPDDPTLAPLLAWAAATRTADAAHLRTPPFTAAEAPELIAIVLAFHYINRMVALFLAPSPLPFESPRLKRVARRALAPVLRGPLARPLVAGESLSFLAAAAHPADLAWSAPHPTLADALARAAAAFEAAGAAHASPRVRALVASRVEAWRGEDPALGQHWCEEAVAPLADDERPRARLALLTVFAPFQVDDELIVDVRRGGADDATLVALAGWASFTAARRIAGWVAR